MRAFYRSSNGLVRLGQAAPTGLVSSVVVPERWGDAFIIWHATFEVVLIAGTGEMMFGVRIGGVGQPSGLDRYQLHFAGPGSRASVFGGGFGTLEAGTVIELFGRMLTADQVDMIAGGFLVGVL